MQSLQYVEDPAAARPGRFRAAWRAAHEPVAGVSRWTQLLAYAVPLVVLPSTIWRFPAAFHDGFSPGDLYVIFLSVVSEAAAFAAVGLIAGWGEVFPRWVPFLHGRRVPTGVAVTLGTIGATILTLLWSVLTLLTELNGTTISGEALPDDFPNQVGGWQEVWYHICYTPLILWGPMLAVLTVAYGKRRRAAGNAPAGVVAGGHRPRRGQ
ncbi:hypothetical protein ACIQRW_38155 [Streptomyces sp. NPDC091287]|uniref:hypothetical protein n=1 Tax=Streptomyces sp. NPDC091287 TaxID=3365988 RepID=UPI0037F2CA81